MFWYRALFNFFTQDDFILINHFSQNNLWQDIKNVFGPPTVTHWRPIHNLYFFVTGNIFDKNYFGYHLVTFLFHIGAVFFVYKTVQKLTNDFKAAMIVGLPIFACYEFIFRREKLDRLFLTMIGSTSVIFLIIRFALFTSRTTFNVYQLELSTKVLSALKYYLLRIAGFAEVSGDQIVSVVLLSWLTLIALLLIKTFGKKQNVNQLLLSIIIIIIGLFPFILIPQHLSPHYMNISIFGFSMFIGLALKQLKPIISIVFLIIFLVTSVYNVNLTLNNNWIIKRSNLAKTYLKKIEREKLIPRSILIFDNNEISTSKEAYIALGTGEAIKFWFKNKNYKYCFTEFEKCQALP